MAENDTMPRLHSKRLTTCYACERVATTRDHVPPLCFFPEFKDSQHKPNYRVNLVTVPACEEHNLSRSEDDFYAYLVMVSSWFGNDVADQQIKTKVARALRRKPTLRGLLERGELPFTLAGDPAIVYSVDYVRLHRVLEAIARNLLCT
jgi:hypothetical protein